MTFYRDLFIIGVPLKTVIASDRRERGDPYLSEFKRFMDCFVASLLAMTRFLEVPLCLFYLSDAGLGPNFISTPRIGIRLGQDKLWRLLTQS